MRSHAKAPSAGSTMRQGNRLGRIFRGALATRGASPRAKGSSAPFFGLAVLGLFSLLLLLAPIAGAATVTERPVLFTLDGSTMPGGPMLGGEKAAVDNASGALYVSESAGSGSSSRIFRFHPDGTLWPFSSTGLPYLTVSGRRPGIAVDNSGGANQGHLYATPEDKTLKAFDASGELLWSGGLPNSGIDVAVDPTGHPYVAFPSGPVRKYANTGAPPAEESSFSVSSLNGIDINAAGEVFLARTSFIPAVEKWVGGSFSSTLDAFGNDVYLDQSSPTGSIFTTFRGRDERQNLTVSATAGQFRLSFGGAQTPDLPYNASESQVRAALEALPAIGEGNVSVGFTPSPPNSKQISFRGFLGQTDVEQVSCENGTTPLSGGTGCSTSVVVDGIPADVQEYSAAGALQGTFGQGELLNGAGGERGSVAYNPSLDRIYALQGVNGSSVPFITALGPLTTGTVADVTIDAPSAIGVATAHFGGTVNPQGTTSEWRFQWRKQGQSWSSAPGSPPQSLPADSTDHTVEYTTDVLRGATNYQVRLVAVNTANQLAGVSEGKIFKTTSAAQAPAVTIDEPSAVTGEGATIVGTVNPQGDTADWRVQISTDPACASGFQNQPLQSISPSSASPVSVEYTVTGLLPSQHYCARILATNSTGSTTSEAKEFETLDVLPTQVFAAYAAPRTDTTARINGYVNPQGSETTYRFEWSPDGSSWNTLPDGQAAEVRRQITVAAELSGLAPSTTYHYRFTVEDDAGSVQSDEKTFQTRSTAEMQLPRRGIELVNQPDKGNQNFSTDFRGGKGLMTTDMVRADGNKVIWELYGGAPGGNTATGANFVSTRTPSGWESQGLAPPGEQQVGGGNFFYKPNSLTPDFRTFLMRSARSGSSGTVAPPASLVRIDDLYHQDVLAEFTKSVIGEDYENTDMTTDGAHIIARNPDNDQLEEIGSEPHEVVSIMPDGQPAECGVARGAFYGQGGGPQHTAKLWHVTYHRMARTDASRLYFQAFPNGGACAESQNHYEALFYRDRGANETVEIDPGTAAEPPGLIRATPDGRSVFFITLTPHAAEDENFTSDVYRWDSADESYACLTCVVADAAVDSGQALISDDFSYIYFTSRTQLVPGHGNPGETMTYSLRLSDGRLNYVTSGQDLMLYHAELSASGNVLVFTSRGLPGQTTSELTADRHTAECIEHVWERKEVGCRETYRYEDSTNSLECLSCLPGGVTTRGGPESDIGLGMSKDGSVVAFTTYERLLPQDINNSMDVYEWRNGALQLISDGETVYPTESFTGAPRVYGVSDSGDDIFFVIIDPGLTGYEQDKLANLYDARVGGGFPRPSETPHCSEESCQGPLQALPSAEAPGSSTYGGPGNVQTRRSCRGTAVRAQRLSRRARHLRRSGRRLAHRNPRRAKQMRRAANRLGKRAHRLSRSATRCRRANRRAGK